jgi:hypothetical protein
VCGVGTPRTQAPQGLAGLTSYDELAVRFKGGYDPALSPVADVEMTPPAGLLLLAPLHGEPVGCGALIFYPDSVGLVKRMWGGTVGPAAWGWARRLLYDLGTRPAPTGCG